MIGGNGRYPKLVSQLGLVPPDTPFNRRAAAYAKSAKLAANSKIAAAKERAKKNARKDEATVDQVSGDDAAE
jgi:hypothetical protein